MSAFENIVIGKNSVPSLIITVILMIAIPVIFCLYWRRLAGSLPVLSAFWSPPVCWS